MESHQITRQPIRPRIVGFTNGCFDALHPGHVKLLQIAANHCDDLWVAVNSDEYCSRKKGASRPLQKLSTRMHELRKVCERLPCRIFLEKFSEDSPEKLLSRIRPDVYILGSDYRDTPLPGREFCGRVVFAERIPGISTTELSNSVRPS